MVFASLLFLFIFLPLNLIFYYSSKNPMWRNWVLIIFSLAFYGWGEPIWISLLILSSTFDWANALFIQKHRGTKWAKAGVVFTLIFNLGLLATFKYDVFLVNQVNALLGTSFTAPGYALPIGISFYTFHTISYVVDVYRGTINAQRNFPRFLMYVSIYSSLVAGPIIRYAHVEKEINRRRETIKDFSLGLSRFCIGLFKKVIIANVAAELVRKYMGDHGDPLTMNGLLSLSSLEAWVGLVMFAIQIYFDFSGYSDMAIGLGRMFGFHFRENFNYPYISKSISEFWRRWHISLSRWLRDYLYISLGGSRGTPLKKYRNLMLTMFLGGLWHGASWNFVIWGIYHGTLLCIDHALSDRYAGTGAFASRHNAVHRAVRMAGMYILTLGGWLLFRVTSMSQAAAILGNMFGNFTWSPEVPMLILPVAVLTIMLFAFHLAQERLQDDLMVLKWPSLVRFGFYIFLLVTVLTLGIKPQPFIYFQF